MFYDDVLLVWTGQKPWAFYILRRILSRPCNYLLLLNFTFVMNMCLPCALLLCVQEQAMSWILK